MHFNEVMSAFGGTLINTAIGSLALMASFLMLIAPERALADPTPACQLAASHSLTTENDGRRLRDRIIRSDDDDDFVFDEASLLSLTARQPTPSIQPLVYEHGDGYLSLGVTARNSTRHGSRDGGITLSFPQLDQPSDDARIESISVPDGMSLHVIPAGGQLYARNGQPSTAQHLMVEVHGPWPAETSRRLELTIRYPEQPLKVRYRSALSDEQRRYLNAPASASLLDQQGWPVMHCQAGQPADQSADRQTQ